MAATVYILCALTSTGCAALLLRGYSQSKMGLLLWSGLCFVALAVSNAVLVLDLLVIPSVDLSLLRAMLGLGGLLVLLYGLIWEVR